MESRTFMVVATIREDTDMAELGALIPEEIAQVELLRTQGRMGSVHVAQPRSTVFIETFANDEATAIKTVETLPLARFFDVDVYETSPPGVPQGLTPTQS